MSTQTNLMPARRIGLAEKVIFWLLVTQSTCRFCFNPIKMKITKVSYSKIYPTASYMNERIGVEIEINEGEDAKGALHAAKILTDEFHKEANPDLYKYNEQTLTPDEIAVKESIEAAKSPQILGMLKNKLTANTKGYYMEKLKALTNNFTAHV
jgi:hypothetical protein